MCCLHSTSSSAFKGFSSDTLPTCPVTNDVTCCWPRGAVQGSPAFHYILHASVFSRTNSAAPHTSHGPGCRGSAKVPKTNGHKGLPFPLNSPRASAFVEWAPLGDIPAALGTPRECGHSLQHPAIKAAHGFTETSSELGSNTSSGSGKRSLHPGNALFGACFSGRNKFWRCH